MKRYPSEVDGLKDGILSPACWDIQPRALKKGQMDGRKFDARTLARLCGLARGTDGVLSFELDDAAYVFEPDGLWLRLSTDFWQLLPQEQSGIIGRDPIELQKADARNLWGLQGPAPLLPFPFTARQLWDFDRGTGNEILESFWQGPETEAWIAEQDQGVQAVARALLSDVAPEDESSGGDVAAGPAIEHLTAEPDYSRLATRAQLIAAFGAFTGMDESWFRRLTDIPALQAARKVAGRGSRGHRCEPMFCPFEVMQWLVSPSRKKGRRVGDYTAWRMLETHFPAVHATQKAWDPR